MMYVNVWTELNRFARLVAPKSAISVRPSEDGDWWISDGVIEVGEDLLVEREHVIGEDFPVLPLIQWSLLFALGDALGESEPLDWAKRWVRHNPMVSRLHADLLRSFAPRLK